MVFVSSAVVSLSSLAAVVVGFVLFVVVELIRPLLLGALGVVVGIAVGVVVGSLGRSETSFPGLLEGPFMISPPSERMEAADPLWSE